MEELKSLNLFECGVCYSTTYDSKIKEPLLKKVTLMPCCNYSIHLPCLLKWQQVRLLCPFCKTETNNKEFEAKLITFTLLSPESDNHLRLKRITKILGCQFLDKSIQNLEFSENTKEKTKAIFLEFYNRYIAEEKTKKIKLLSLYKKITKIPTDRPHYLTAMRLESYAAEITILVIATLFLCAFFSTMILPVYWT